MVLQAIRYTPGKATEPASLRVLDQLLLPHNTVYNPVTSCEDGFDSIKQMRVRGAPAIAIVAALALAVELSQSQTLPSDVSGHIIRRLEYLKTSRPTAVNLGDAVQKLSKIVTQAATQSNEPQQIVQRYIQAAEYMLISDVSDNRAIGFHGARWILDNTDAGKTKLQDPYQTLSILTICNTGSLATAGYGTALGVIRALHDGQHLTKAYACETRPYNQGSRLTAYELVHDQIPATLITDSMAASLLQKQGHRIAAIVVGADRVAANGDTANKIGTYSLAVLARYHGVKFLVAAPRTTIDLYTASGSDIVIEERPPNEVTRIKGPRINLDESLSDPVSISVAADGIDVWNPAFDVTPAELVDGVITEVGVVTKVDGRFDFGPIFAQTSDNDFAAKPSTIGSL